MTLTRQLAEFDSTGMQAHVAGIVCRCGWLASEMPGRAYVCENPLCDLQLKVFRIDFLVIPLQERGVN